MIKFFRVWIAAFVAIFMLGLPVAVAQEAEQRFVRGSSPGYFYVPEAGVVQNTSSAAIRLNQDGVGMLRAGMQFVFETKIINGNNANITLEIFDSIDGSKGVKKLLTREGQEFGIGELDEDVFITATYTPADNFRANFSKRPQFRYVEPANLTLTGNAYSFTDASIPPIATEPVLLGIKAKATNTGNVTLEVNGSTDYPVYLSNGAQIPPGALEDGEFILCAFTNIGGVGFRALNLRPARSLKGQLLATLEVPAGDYTSSGGLLTGWVLEAGVTEIEIIDFPGGGFYGAMVTDGMIAFPLEQFSESQLGWFIEVDNGTIPVFTELKLFGYSSSSFALEIVGTDDPAVQFTMRWPAANTFTGVDRIGLTLNPFSTFTLATPYTFNLYVTEN